MDQTKQSAGSHRWFAGCFVCVALALAAFPVAASADFFETLHGYRILKNGAGETVRAWSPSQWGETQRELSEYASQESYATTSEWYASVEGVPGSGYEGSADKAIAEDAAEGVAKARALAPGDDVPAVEGLDFMSEAGGTLGAAAGASALGVVTLGGPAFLLGVEIGNGFDSIFHLPEWHPLETGEEEKVEEHGYSIFHDPTTGPLVTEKRVERELEFGGFTETEKSHHLEPGYYINYGGYSPGEGELKAGGISKECRDFECKEVAEPPPPAPEGFEEFRIVTDVQSFWSEHEYHYNTIETIWQVKPEPECDAGIWEVETDLPTCLEAWHVPSPETLPPEVEKANTEHGLAKRPSEEGEHHKKEVPLVPGPDVEKFFERERLPEELPHIFPREKEREEEGIEIPESTPTETGIEFQKKLEELGFKSTSVATLPDADTDRAVGPGITAYTSPGEHTRQKPSTHVTVEQNPEDAPAPEEPGVLAPPSLPGIHLPKLGVLCERFPFGVPCWVAGVIGKMVAAKEAPELGVGEWEIPFVHVTVPSTKVNLAKLEPLMEVVRPLLLFFITVGLVIRFFRLATGKSASGSVFDEGSDEL